VKNCEEALPVRMTLLLKILPGASTESEAVLVSEMSETANRTEATESDPVTDSDTAEFRYC
jgi:hypothetical protein